MGDSNLAEPPRQVTLPPHTRFLGLCPRCMYEIALDGVLAGMRHRLGRELTEDEHHGAELVARITAPDMWAQYLERTPQVLEDCRRWALERRGSHDPRSQGTGES